MPRSQNKKLALTSWVVLYALVATQCYAAGSDRQPLQNFGDPAMAEHSPSEFVYRNDPEEILIPVYLLGAVAKPGLYHVPVKTDLVNLLAISGGPTSDAKLDDIQIRRIDSNKSFHVSEVDFEKSLKETPIPGIVMESNDVVLVKQKQPIVSNNTVIALGMLSALATIVLSVVLITRKNSN
jgi:hypothetical protein